ncbi:MAG: 6-bladed beta-propeller [Marinilabiliaceae bacterium]|jgi:hypothetical protein|nr:6-bladed beta-propeller [Marinilabiliaceae bacterium]
MKNIFLIVSILFLLILSCINNNNSIDNIRTIDFSSSNFTGIENVLFDTVVSELEYVVLETTPECLINNVGGVTVTDNEILIFGNTGILVFDRQGYFIMKMGSQGKGPQEYNSPLKIMHNHKTGIYTIDDYKHILQFDSNYNFIRKIKQPENLKRIHQLGPDLFFAERNVEASYGDSIVYSLEFFDSEFNSIFRHRSHESAEQPEGHLFIIDLMGGVSISDKHVLFREAYGDTIYAISSIMEVEPLLVMDYGKEKYPKELNFNMSRYLEESKNYIIPGLFKLNGNWLFSQFHFDGHSMYALTDISNNNIKIPYNKESEEYGFKLSAFPAYNFRPAFIDGYLSYVIQATDAIKFFDPETETLPEEIKEKISALGENDNPVLVLGKL